jgi:uncharacterized protein YycO
MKDLIQRVVLNFVAYVSKITSEIHAPFSRKRIKASHYHKVRHVIKPGSIILSATYGELANIFIPGKWSHVGIIATDGMSVIEAISTGVAKTDLIDFMMTKDEICVLNPSFLDTDGMIEASIKAEAEIGKPYDWKFVKGDIKAFYCSELVYHVLHKVKNDSPFTLRRTFGKLTVTPQDFYNAKSKFYVMWKSH